MSLKGKKIVIGLTGGIACYKIPYLVRFLTGDGAEVRIIMTDAATKFITPLTLETVSGYPVATDLFPPDKFIATRHIDLAQWPDLLVIAPATANFLGKTASGVSDDLLTTVVCATAKPVLIVPAMNPQMWLNKITRRNYQFLKESGYLFIEPGEGDTACGDQGVGRMAEPQQIFETVRDFLNKSSKKKVLTGRKYVITAGPTREAIDPVRYISNQSSGKMGYALAEAAVRLGAETVLISGPTALTPPDGVRLVRVTTTTDLHQAVKNEFDDTDCLVMAAAPADYTPVEEAPQKIKKSRSHLKLALAPTVDILKEIGKGKKPGQVLVGFALETEKGIENAQKKLEDKHLDLIVLNNPKETGAGFEHDTNIVTLISPGKKTETWPLDTKANIALKLLVITSEMF
ncbi:MAG: bifunctional phosphopantothenoylcysteine decarboxylase/phosphopantothenate--cysteine ligase CoaBC [Candidatus Zixiibacteriota bacterium]